ncbi:MAG: hypothetical protein EAZ95_01385 [Bacteroidetes bacterium]|nr:MAG: hypothetical protein EAZ95_01385 [Bacteroidota bacterium]
MRKNWLVIIALAWLCQMHAYAQVETRSRYMPLGGKTKFVAGETGGYTSGLAQEFLRKYHAGKTFKTYYDKNAQTYFQFKFERNIDQNTTEEVYMGFQNYADGLAWNFWTYTLKRHTQNLFAIVGKEEVGEKIKVYLKKHYSIDGRNLPDVFEYVYDNFQTSQQSENLDFPDRNPETLYGVYAQKKLYLFDLKGDFVRVE